MQRSFKPQNTGQYRGGPPAFAICAAGGEGCRAKALECERGLSCLSGYGLAGHFFASSQQPAGFLCKETQPGQHRQEAPRFFDPVAQLLERGPPKAEVAGEIPVRSTSFGRVVQRE